MPFSQNLDCFIMSRKLIFTDCTKKCSNMTRITSFDIIKEGKYEHLESHLLTICLVVERCELRHFLSRLKFQFKSWWSEVSKVGSFVHNITDRQFG